MMIPTNFLRLFFNSFPREVGIRWVTNSWKGFLNYILSQNGKSDVYTSLYDGVVIDKLFFDLDGSDSLRVAQEFTDEWRELPVIAVASGKKGIHLYIPVKPLRMDGKKERVVKNYLRSISLGLMNEVFGKIPSCVDTHVIGDLRRLVRVPGTLRPPENETMCKILPNGRWRQWSESDLHEFISVTCLEHHDIKAVETFPRADLDDCEKFTITTISCDNPHHYDDMPIPITFTPRNQRKSMLSMVLRPCTHHHATLYEAPHWARYALVTELAERDFTRGEILSIIAQIGWDDYDPEITAQQVDHILMNGYRTPSCKRLLQQGRCLYPSNQAECPFLKITSEVRMKHVNRC